MSKADAYEPDEDEDEEEEEAETESAEDDDDEWCCGLTPPLLPADEDALCSACTAAGVVVACPTLLVPALTPL